MIKYILVVILVFISTLFAQDLPVVAIMDFDESGMTESDGANITTRFGFELSKANKFTIIEREKMEEILNEQGFQQSRCSSSECAVEAGELLGVEYMIAGEVTKTFGLYSLHVRLISVETGVITAQVVEDHTGSAADFLTNNILSIARESNNLSSSRFPEISAVPTFFFESKSSKNSIKNIVPGININMIF